MESLKVQIEFILNYSPHLMEQLEFKEKEEQAYTALLIGLRMNEWVTTSGGASQVNRTVNCWLRFISATPYRSSLILILILLLHRLRTSLNLHDDVAGTWRHFPWVVQWSHNQRVQELE